MIHYRVSMPQPHSHLIEVEAYFPAVAGALDAVMAVWTPGSYLLREYARHLQDVTATTAGGEPLVVTRRDKRTFRVESNGRPVVFRYRVYANELTVRTSHLDGTHAAINGATVFLTSDAERNEPHHVVIGAPEGWVTHVALPRMGEAFVARDFDELVDSPFEIGAAPVFRFTVAGVPHELVIWGEPLPDTDRMVADLRRICEVQAQLFGGPLPFERYVFLLYLVDKGRGGLEHKASCSLLFPRFPLQSAKGWEDFLTLAAHEYFHLWNIKRVKPGALVPFDYSQENYTSLLWAFEGGTSYYDNLVVMRSGLMSPQRYLTRLGETLSLLQQTQGRRVQKLEDASFLAWIKAYRPDENSPNSAISYYLKGEVVCALLDLELRRATQNAKSLDDVMKLLWQRYGDESGVPEEGVEAAALEVGGQGLKPFFDRAIRSTEELDYGVFAHVGLEVRYRVREAAGDRGGTPPRRVGDTRPRGWLGITPRGNSTIGCVIDGSPAMEAGLYANDEIVALDGFKVDGSTLVNRCEDRAPGETVRVHVFRREKLLEVPVILRARPHDGAYLARIEAPSDDQRVAFRSWLGGGLEDVTA